LQVPGEPRHCRAKKKKIVDSSRLDVVEIVRVA
jgi:hypothetical protein